MDEHEQDAPPTPPYHHPYGAPYGEVPPLPPMAPPPPPAAPEPKRTGPRLVAAGTAVALVVAAGGAGYALGHRHSHASAGGAPNGGYSFGQGGQGGQGGVSPFGGGTPFTGPGGPGGSPFDSTTGGTPANDTQLTGLVRIATTLKYQGGRAAGTGMILTSTGEVLTNHHVVAGATKIRVTVMSTGQHYRATVVGTDAKDDVAVLQLANANGLSVVKTDTSGAAVGDAVTAVGDAGGSSTTFSAASGKVTALDQHITTRNQDGSTSEKLSGLMEISSDVISGDSGGATYDAQGEVVGMTTAASSGEADVVGYAIPISKALSIATDLENGTVNARYAYGSPAFLGLGLRDSSPTVGAVYPGTPAARAGLTAGDTVTRVGSTRVTTAAGLRRAITAYSPGDSVRLTWTDPSGTTHLATVTLIAGPIA